MAEKLAVAKELYMGRSRRLAQVHPMLAQEVDLLVLVAA